MKTYNHLFDSICSFENLMAAARAAERGRRLNDHVGRFRTRMEAEVLRLRKELTNGIYQPGSYREFWIREPKERMISAAPYRDRVVHHAVCRVVMPLFERKMIADLYSNRPGKGTHAAIRRCQHWCRKYRYVLKCDVTKYFPSMDHAVLKQAIRRTIRCQDTLRLMDAIIDNSNLQEAVCTVFPGDDIAEAAERRVGLPIGNLTSQWFGGIYLTAFDHWVQETLRAGAYVRYVDDFLLFSDDKVQLREWRQAICERLHMHRVRLNERKSRVYRVQDGVTFLGQRVWPGRRRLARANVARVRRRLRAQADLYRAGQLAKDSLIQRWASWKGHALQADGTALVAVVRDELRRRIGNAGNESVSGAAGRVVEQQREQRAGREPEQQQPGQREQQHWFPLREGDSSGREAVGRSREVYEHPWRPGRKPTRVDRFRRSWRNEYDTPVRGQ